MLIQMVNALIELGPEGRLAIDLSGIFLLETTRVLMGVVTGTQMVNAPIELEFEGRSEQLHKGPIARQMLMASQVTSRLRLNSAMVWPTLAAAIPTVPTAAIWPPKSS